jgi:uncharacterized iron-regulated membrane protein
VVGWSGFVILALLTTGIMAWWPRGSWRKALALKRDAVPLRRLRDLHKLSGLWSMMVLVLLVATGTLLALPDVKQQILTATIAAPDTVPEPRSGNPAGPQISIARALVAARRAVPGARLAFIDVPATTSDPFRMRVQVPGDPHSRFPGSFVFVDQYSGAVLAVHDVRRGNAATSLSTWIRPIHDGSVGGLPVRILALIIGLVPSFLFATGLLRWLKRRKAARLRAHSTTAYSTGRPS